MTKPDYAPWDASAARVVKLDVSRIEEMFELESMVWGAVEALQQLDLWKQAIDPDRTFGVEINENGGTVLAACASAWGFDTPVPGGRVKAGGLTWVGVKPGYRRRGLLRALIDAHFQDTRERGEPLSMLFASDMAIYGRFGYAVANRGVSLTIPRGAALRPAPVGADSVTVSFATASFEEHNSLVESIDHQIGYGPGARPGWVGSVNSALQRLRFVDVSPTGPDWEPLRIALALVDGQPSGYALFRRKNQWPNGAATSPLKVEVLQAVDPASGYALWRELINFDLVGTVETFPIPLDDPLLQWLVNWRTAQPQLLDREYARLLDLGAAFRARRYGIPLDLRLAVSDSLVPSNAGIWRLVGGPNSTEATREFPLVGTRTSDDAVGVGSTEGGGPYGNSGATDDGGAYGNAGARSQGDLVADVELDIRELSALYLGGTGALELKNAGLIRENTPGSVVLLNRALRGDQEPGTPRDF
jgi:predicted acetyltransferase